MNWAAFCSYVLLTAITPGPNNIMSMSNAAKYGFKRSFPFNVGVLLGFLVVMGLCAAFSSLLYEFIPSVKPYMLCLGAAYILWLAWSIWRDKPHAEKKSIFARTNTVVAGADNLPELLRPAALRLHPSSGALLLHTLRHGFSLHAALGAVRGSI